MSVLLFPSLATLAAVLSEGLLPERVTTRPVRFAVGPDGRVWIEVEKYPRTLLSRLGRLGVAAPTVVEVEPDQSAAHWYAVPPLARDENGTTGPVLFELPSARRLPEFVAEARRLHSGTLGWQIAPDTGRALVRVARPSLFTLLRGEGDHPERPRAYVEQSPRVWVQFGYRHPVSTLPSPPEGFITLIDFPRQWRQAPDRPYRGDDAKFDVAVDVEWPPDDLVPKLTIVPRLIPDRHSVAATFWVIDEPAVDRLMAFLRRADERLIARLHAGFVVVEGRVQAMIAARGAALPPVVMLDAVGFRPYANLPNLFIPVNNRLTPPLRRDIARRELSPDSERLYWLQQSAEGLRRYAAPAGILRPLAQWVKYSASPVRPIASVDFAPVFSFDPWEVSERTRAIRVPRRAASEPLIWTEDGWRPRVTKPNDA